MREDCEHCRWCRTDSDGSECTIYPPVVVVVNGEILAALPPVEPDDGCSLWDSAVQLVLPDQEAL